MQQEQPQFYATLASHLSAEEQTIIQGVFNQAEAQLVMAQQQQVAAAQQGAAPGGAMNGGTS
jgi:hypothetical protein